MIPAHFVARLSEILLELKEAFSRKDVKRKARILCQTL